MTAPAAAPAAPQVGEPNAAGEAPIRFPVLVLEGQETSDGRFLEAGSLSPRAFPISLLAVAESPHGGQDSSAAVIVGRITAAHRVPGAEVTSKRTGAPFPDGSFVWVAEGVIDTTAEVPVGNTSRNAYDLVKSGQLRGVSVDLAGMDYDVVDETTFDANNPRRQLIVHAAEIAAATMVPIPAFADAYGELPGDDTAFTPASDAALAASGAPAWRSSEVGDYAPHPAIVAAADQGMPVRIPPDSVEQLVAVIDSGEERDAQQLAEAVVEHIAMNWAATTPITEDELPDGGDDGAMAARPDTLADDTADSAGEDLDDEGDPAEPQACIYGDEPAVRSLLYQDGGQFVSVCDEHDPRAREELEKAGETISGEVAIDGAEPEAEAVVAAASVTDLPDIAWFRDPQLDGLTPLTVTADGRVVGHLAGWGTDHTSFPGRRIKPPRSAMDYSLFHVGSALANDGGEVREISVGRLVMGTGHAATDLGAQATADWYDNTGKVVAVVCAGEDAHGIWYSGAVLPDVDEVTLRRFRACALSGDWRRFGSNLELVAALAVATPGYPIPRARVAAGAPQALVAAGALPASEPAGAVVLDYDTLADAIAARLEARGLSAESAALLAALDERPAEVVGLLSVLDERPAEVLGLLAELGEDDESVEDFLSKMPPQLKKEWLVGKVAARIGWGSPGDFDRCVAQARKHDVPAAQRKGMCNNLHREATGQAPGKH